MNKTTGIRAVVPAAGLPKNRLALNSNLPDTMMVINGKPVIGHILEDLIERRITDISVVLHERDKHTESYIERNFGKKCRVKCIYNKKPERGLGYSVLLATQQEREKSILIYLGDTIYKGPLSFKKDFLVVAPYKEEPNRWCFVETVKHQRLKFIDKPESHAQSGQILSGIYFFSSLETLRKSATRVLRQTRIEMSDLLSTYQDTRRFQLVPAKRWYDCGNIENYYRARIDFLKRRSFNTLRYDDMHGTMTKTSRGNPTKIRAEIYWYQKLPKALQIFVPRLVHSKEAVKNTEYTLEYYGYPTLSDIFLFQSVDISVWKSLFTHLFSILGEFRKYTHPISKSDCRHIYATKTRERLLFMQRDPRWAKLMQAPTILVEGKKLQNLPAFLPTLEKRIDALYRKGDASVLHGDLCFSNILFDPASRIVKFIDPRGNFGKESIYGDIKYDLAKLRHSVHGYYDFIVNDLFEVSQSAPTSFGLVIYAEAQNARICEAFDAELRRGGYAVRDIAFIEGLLFLSMLPLHADNSDRQKAMYLRGIQILNESLPV